MFGQLWAACAAILISGASQAEQLGWSLAITNDSMGDQRDRWQSSSVQLGMFYGDVWNGYAPAGFGDLVEIRLQNDLYTPEHLTLPDPSDRRHAGAWTLGVHSHNSWGNWQGRTGAELAVIGPQTGMLEVQRWLHRATGFPVPTLDDFQIGNQFQGNLSGEIGYEWRKGSVSLRPFIEAAAGVEDFARAGLDISFGNLSNDALMVRTAASGQRVEAISGGKKGYSVVLGADWTRVFDSVYLPANLGYELTESRHRLRWGVRYSGQKYNIFYGATWLSPEFVSQREGQILGTIQVKW